MIKRTICCAIIMLMLCLNTKAQDPHFSQYFASPLTLNPALTGFFDGDFRVALNERQQWFNIGSTYSTTSLSADLKILKDHIPVYDTFGVGVSAIFDQSLNGALQSNYISLSGAYHKALADEGRQVLTVGFQTTLANRYIDFNKLTFGSQFNGEIFDTKIPVNLNYGNNSTLYFEVNTGILYALRFDNASFYAGASLYHVNKPTESLFSPNGDQIPLRSTFHTGGEININTQSAILYSGVYMAQGGATDQLIGGAYALKTSSEFTENAHTRVYVGMWYRFDDAYIPYIGMDYNDFSVGLNYSINQNPIYTFTPNAVEFSIIYRSKFTTNRSATCPRF